MENLACEWGIVRGNLESSGLDDEANERDEAKLKPQNILKNNYDTKYDGLASVDIDLKQYQLNKVTCILNDDSLSSELKEKLSQHVLRLLQEENGDNSKDELCRIRPTKS